MMEHRKLIAALKQLKVETGRLACLGCGYEHNCGIHGCAIIRDAVEALEARPSEPMPLTLEQLHKMHGQPVWVEFEDGSGGLWGIVHIAVFDQIIFANGLHCTIGMPYYGKTYKAYAYYSAHIDANELKQETLTRADLVRRMSDEELAREINRLMEGELVLPYCRELPVCDDDLERDQPIPLERCEACVIHWLQQPAEEDQS